MHRALALLGLLGWCFGCGAGTVPVRDEAAPARVLPGITVLLADSLDLVRNRRIGLVTNQAGVDADGISDVARLRAAGVQLVALFSPEHGFRGAADPGAAVASSEDSATGLPIYSLYGRTSAPTDEMLRNIDLMVVDLQDAGARYYTYLATTVEVMQAAGGHRLPVMVLDRPNPIGGLVQGNVLDPAFVSAVGRLAVPMRHGMTLGELARLAVADLGIDVTLTVVPVVGWRRSQALDQTGLPFVPPSPNLRSIESLFHYPGLCLFEGTNLSVGRGSDAPFEQIGAPWLDTAAVLSLIHRAQLPGVRFRGVEFTPRRPGDGKFADTVVAGIRLEVTDRSTYDPTATAVFLLSAIRTLHQDHFAWIPAHFDRLAGGLGLRTAIDSGESPDSIVRSWKSALGRFEARRRPFLLYGDSKTRVQAASACRPPDARSVRMIRWLTNIVGGTDPGSVQVRKQMKLPQVGPSQIAYVTDNTVCSRALGPYNASSGIREAGVAVASSGQLYVVKVGPVYVANDPAKSAGEFTIYVTLDGKFRFLASSLG